MCFCPASNFVTLDLTLVEQKRRFAQVHTWSLLKYNQTFLQSSAFLINQSIMFSWSLTCSLLAVILIRESSFLQVEWEYDTDWFHMQDLELEKELFWS